MSAYKLNFETWTAFLKKYAKYENHDRPWTINGSCIVEGKLTDYKTKQSVIMKEMIGSIYKELSQVLLSYTS